MIESQQDRELALTQLAEAWDEGFDACLIALGFSVPKGDCFSDGVVTSEARSVNPYRMKEEK